MSGSDIHGLIPHQTGYYYITLEEDYVVMFQRAALRWFELTMKTQEDEKTYSRRRTHSVAKSYISSVLEQLSDKQYKNGVAPGDIWVFLSFPELESRLHGACKMRTLKDAMKEMIEDGYVQKRPNPDRRFKALIYHMNVDKYREELTALPKRLGKGESANLHDAKEKKNESAKTHDDSANLHDDDAKMHEPQCKSAPKNNNRYNKEETKKEEGITEVSANGNIPDPETGDLAHANRTPTPSLLSEENLIPPALTLPQRDNKQARMDEVEQHLIYMDLSANVKSEVVYLTEEKLFEVRYTRSVYNGEDMTFFIVKDPHTNEENTYRTETFLKFTEMLRQHSSELKRLILARDVKNILAEIDRPEPPTLPVIPHTPPFEATNSGGVSPIPATTPLQASNLPSAEEIGKDTASAPTMPISGSPPQIEASVSGEEDESASKNSQQASGVSHSQGTPGNVPASAAPKKKPQMPADDAPWNAETFVQTLEAHRGRRYPNGARKPEDRVRDVEKEASETLISEASDIWEDCSTSECREILLKIVKRIENKDNRWWFEHNGFVLPHQLLDKDRIHTVYDELVRMRQIPKPKQAQEAEPPPEKEPVPVQVGERMVVQVPARQKSELEQSIDEMKRRFK